MQDSKPDQKKATLSEKIRWRIVQTINGGINFILDVVPGWKIVRGIGYVLKKCITMIKRIGEFIYDLIH